MLLTASRPSRNSKVATVRPLISSAKSVPAPIWGWDALNPVSKMPPDHAVRLVNWFPQTSWVELRKGYVVHANTATDEPVESLMAYQGLTSAKLFAASADSVFDVTVEDSVTTEVTGLANARIQHTNFATTGGNFLYCVNGADTPFYYDGSTWQTATITGSGIDATEWVQVNVFKNRLFFVKNNSTSFDYLPVDSIQGTAAEFELGGLMSMGGYIMAMSTWSIDAGDGPEDYAVFVTSRGQVIIYRGTDPGEADSWALVGVFFMGAPIGRRCMTKVGADVAIICIDGVLPLSKAMVFERAAVVKISLTERIQRVMNESARAYKNNFGWQLISYPQGTRCVLNIPVEENVTQEQYVMNTITGAWCKYTGHNGSCWELLNDNIYFGDNTGRVMLADSTGSDNGEAIVADMMTAFYDYGTAGVVKRWVQCQPLMTTDSQVIPGIAFNVDFQENAPLSVSDSVVTPGAEWDLSAWDQVVWPGEVTSQTNWLGATGIGHWMSIRCVVNIQSQGLPDAEWGVDLWGGGLWYSDSFSAPEVTLQLNGFNIVYETGRAFI
jgi:hypothetical protein